MIVFNIIPQLKIIIIIINNTININSINSINSIMMIMMTMMIVTFILIYQTKISVLQLNNSIIPHLNKLMIILNNIH